MRNILRFVFSLCLIIFLFAAISHAEEANEIATLMNKFYNGLADIIERNMDSPDACVAEVESYYENNKEAVDKIRSLMEKALAQAMAMAKELEAKSAEYSKKENMSPSELAELAEKEAALIPKPSPARETERYSKALAAFSAKYPKQGLKIATKSLLLLPEAKPGQ